MDTLMDPTNTPQSDTNTTPPTPPAPALPIPAAAPQSQSLVPTQAATPAQQAPKPMSANNAYQKAHPNPSIPGGTPSAYNPETGKSNLPIDPKKRMRSNIFFFGILFAIAGFLAVGFGVSYFQSKHNIHHTDCYNITLPAGYTTRTETGEIGTDNTKACITRATSADGKINIDIVKGFIDGDDTKSTVSASKKAKIPTACQGTVTKRDVAYIVHTCDPNNGYSVEYDLLGAYTKLGSYNKEHLSGLSEQNDTEIRIQVSGSDTTVPTVAAELYEQIKPSFTSVY